MKENIQPEKIVVDELDRGFCDEVASLPGGQNIRKCFACGTCAAGCPVTGIDEQYNCRKIIRQVAFGMREEVLSSLWRMDRGSVYNVIALEWQMNGSSRKGQSRWASISRISRRGM